MYHRPHEVEGQIDEVLGLSLQEIKARLQSRSPESAGYLRSESLVYLVRVGRREGNQALMNAVLPILLGRCEANLRVKVPDALIPAAADVRQQILDEFVDLFAVDGTPDSKNELDFFECRFNSALRSLRIDALRCSEAEQKNFQIVDTHPPDEIETNGPYDDLLARIAEAYQVPPTQERDAARSAWLEFIKSLPAEECQAVMLVYVLGYKEESDNPNQETAATRCGCSGRTIRTRLKQAAKRLSQLPAFKELLEIA